MNPPPTVILLQKEIGDGCVVEFHVDPYSKRVGVLLVPGSKTPRLHASPKQKDQLKMWQIIQKERRRLKLPPLTSEEMRIW